MRVVNKMAATSLCFGSVDSTLLSKYFRAGRFALEQLHYSLSISMHVVSELSRDRNRELII